METGYKIVGIEAKTGDEFITYQSGYNRLDVIKQFGRYFQPFKVVSVTPC